METTRGTLGLLRHLDASLASRPEDELIAQVLGGAEPPAALLATAARLARLPFWERRALGASGLVRDHRVPPREAIRLAALWELAERWYPDERPAVSTPGAALHLLQGLRALSREEVWALFLDARHRLISVEPVVAGSLNSARLLPRDVLAPALRSGAAALIVAHNHPSGEVAPRPGRPARDRLSPRCRAAAGPAPPRPPHPHRPVSLLVSGGRGLGDGWGDGGGVSAGAPVAGLGEGPSVRRPPAGRGAHPAMLRRAILSAEGEVKLEGATPVSAARRGRATEVQPLPAPLGGGVR